MMLCPGGENSGPVKKNKNGKKVILKWLVPSLDIGRGGGKEVAFRPESETIQTQHGKR